MEAFTKFSFFKFLILLCLLGIETCRAALKVHDKLESGSDKIVKKRQAPYYNQPPQAAPYYPPPPNYNNYPPPPAPYNYPPQPNNNYGHNDNYGYNGNNNNYGYNSNNNYGYNGGGSNSGGYGYENLESYGESCYNSAKCNCYEPYDLYPCQAGSDPTAEYSEYGYGYGGSNDCACTEAHHPNGCTLVNCTTSTSNTNDPWCLCTDGAKPKNCFSYTAYFDTQSNQQSVQQFKAEQIKQFQNSDAQNQQTHSDSQSLQSSDTESDDQLQNILASSNLGSLQDSGSLDASELQGLLDSGLLDSGLLDSGLLENLQADSLTSGLLGGNSGLLGAGLLGGVGGGVQDGHNVVGSLPVNSLINAKALDSSTTVVKKAPATAQVFKVIQ